MKKYINNLLFLALLFPSFVWSQADSLSQDSAPEYKPRYEIQVGTRLNYGSTNLTNPFVDKLLFGGKINEELKDKVADRTNKRNRFGGEISFEAKFIELKDTIFPKLPSYRYYIGFGSYNYLNSSFTQDFFQLMFYGNKQFENEVAELGRSNFTSFKFEKITFGLTSKESNTSFGVSLIIGDRFNSINIKQADLFTYPEGTELSLEYDGKIRLSDRDRQGFMAFSGVGFGFDFEKQFLNNKITARVTNLGMTFWKKNTSYSNHQSTTNFEGVEIDNILQTSSAEYREKAEDLLPSLSDDNFVAMLPTIVEIDKTLDLEKKSQPIYGFRYQFFSNYLPHFYGGIHYRVNNKFMVKSQLAWGGYAGLRLELGAYYQDKRIRAGLESTNFSGMILPNGNGNGVVAYAAFIL